ncbi:ATP-binding cassette domain-containing protein [Rathayibacter festucae]|uniref:ATP-binding cassette domain-containing protein n=1 Tax=Rathayibacter festucae TaxID=110937 RepID=A0ABX6GXW6_9MICO|nr:ATP-binding cassette domain-containing protein [Rathayibacter festucae]
MPDNDTPRRLLDVRSLGKRMGSVDVLDDVSFTIDAGEVVGLVGPNGAGKTTLMRTLAGLYEPSHGSALVLGHVIGTTGARRALSLMPEEPDLYPGLSVVEHVRLIERLSGSPRNESLGPSLLERYGLSDKQDLLPHQLSQGDAPQAGSRSRAAEGRRAPPAGRAVQRPRCRLGARAPERGTAAGRGRLRRAALHARADRAGAHRRSSGDPARREDRAQRASRARRSRGAAASGGRLSPCRGSSSR